VAVWAAAAWAPSLEGRESGAGRISLPAPQLDSDTSVERALESRRSRRDYPGRPLTLAELSQLLWAAQGITGDRGKRTAPSAGALYPLELLAVARNVAGLPPGVYRYVPASHELESTGAGEEVPSLLPASLMQQWVEQADAVLVFAGVYERTTAKYGERGARYVHIEVGHAAQNVYLQAVSLGLGTTMVGAFDDETVKRILGLKEEEEPLGIMPVGRN
jgi:SagB-type dehydrogenase family enzyme